MSWDRGEKKKKNKKSQNDLGSGKINRKRRLYNIVCRTMTRRCVFMHERKLTLREGQGPIF